MTTTQERKLSFIGIIVQLSRELEIIEKRLGLSEEEIQQMRAEIQAELDEGCFCSGQEGEV
jgi:hypothetical protein